MARDIYPAVVPCRELHSRACESPINMVEYTFEEYTDMMFMNGLVEGNGRAARQLY